MRTVVPLFFKEASAIVSHPPAIGAVEVAQWSAVDEI
jgi:hypothetical protein